MAVTPLGNIILTNQNAPAASNAQQNVQHRMDFQNQIAAELANEKEKAVEETRPTEMTSAVNPDRLLDIKA